MSFDPPSDISRLEDALEIVSSHLSRIADQLERIGNALQPKKTLDAEIEGLAVQHSRGG